MKPIFSVVDIAVGLDKARPNMNMDFIEKGEAEVPFLGSIDRGGQQLV